MKPDGVIWSEPTNWAKDLLCHKEHGQESLNILLPGFDFVPFSSSTAIRPPSLTRLFHPPASLATVLRPGPFWEVPPLEIEGHVDQADHDGYLDKRADDRGKTSPELIPNTATATAMASSKLLLAAVKDRVAVCE